MKESVARFWREIPQRYNFIGNKCEVCDKVFFPPKEVCPYCRRKSLGKMREFKLSGRGEILTYTIIYSAPEYFEGQTPYAVGIIKLEEGPCVTAQIVDCDLEDIKIGMKVQSTFRKIQQDGRTGAIYYGYKFKPMESR